MNGKTPNNHKHVNPPDIMVDSDPNLDLWHKQSFRSLGRACINSWLSNQLERTLGEDSSIFSLESRGHWLSVQSLNVLIIFCTVYPWGYHSVTSTGQLSYLNNITYGILLAISRHNSFIATGLYSISILPLINPVKNTYFIKRLQIKHKKYLGNLPYKTNGISHDLRFVNCDTKSRRS